MDAGYESVEAGDVVPLAWQERKSDQFAERMIADSVIPRRLKR
jgi:hypothetical protein